MARTLTSRPLPASQKAIVQAKEPVGSLILCADCPLPDLLPGQVLVQTVAVALNPCDWKMPMNFPCPGAVDGSDYAGTVIALGSAVASDLQIGDRVAGAVHASNSLNPRSGAFADYIAVFADQLWRVPDGMPWEQAAAIGWCVVGTLGLAMFRSLALPGTPEQPVQKPTYVLVYGGSTASGTMAVQLLTLSGFKVVTTCSPRHFQLVESYGAERAFDYHSPTCAEDIRAYTKNTLQYVIDIITEAKTLRLCFAAIGRAGGRYVGFELIPDDLIAGMRKTVKATWVLGITMSGSEIALGGGYGSKPNPELREFGCEWFKRFEVLASAGKIKAHPPNVKDGGLEFVISGVDRMRRREVSGEKLVYMFNSELSCNVPSAPTRQEELSTQKVGKNGDLPINISSVPTTQKGLKIRGPGKMGLAGSLPIPRTQDDEVLVRVCCVALNPYDSKSSDLSPSLGATSGCDFSGEVVTIGRAVKKSLSIGDRVCGCVFGNNPNERDNGAFAEFVAVPGDLVFKLPPDMSFQTAATLALGMATVGMALYHGLRLPLPRSPARMPASEPRFVLVYGGGTATGTLAIQTIRLSGMVPVTTCSPRNFSLVKSLGAAGAFDYHLATCGADILAYTKNSLEYALDCISDTESMKICYTAIGKNGGQYMALDPFPVRAHTRRDIKPDWMIMFTMFNKPINWQKPFQRDPQPKDREFAERWFQVAQGLIDDGAIIPHPHEERPGGFAGVIDGLDRVRKGKVWGSKLVYRLRDCAFTNNLTPGVDSALHGADSASH
ncbi:MAG: hypothetical protein Q9187_000536 [Circinaria calcarea]